MHACIWTSLRLARARPPPSAAPLHACAPVKRRSACMHAPTMPYVVHNDMGHQCMWGMQRASDGIVGRPRCTAIITLPPIVSAVPEAVVLHPACLKTSLHGNFQASGEEFNTLVKSGTLTIIGPPAAIEVRARRWCGAQHRLISLSVL